MDGLTSVNRMQLKLVNLNLIITEGSRLLMHVFFKLGKVVRNATKIEI